MARICKMCEQENDFPEQELCSGCDIDEPVMSFGITSDRQIENIKEVAMNRNYCPECGSPLVHVHTGKEIDT